MKRYIRSSTSNKINLKTLANGLKGELEELLPASARIKINPGYDIISIYDVKMSPSRFKETLGDAIENAGYTLYSFNGTRGEDAFAAVDNNDAWASISYGYMNWEGFMFAVYLDSDHDSATLEDWYNEED